MNYVPYYSIRAFADDIATEVNNEAFDITKWEYPTRMYKCLKLIGEIDRLTQLLINAPTTIQAKLQSDIDKLNAAVKKLNLDVTNNENLGNKVGEVIIEVTKKEPNSDHPYIQMLNSYKDKGLSFDRALSLTAGTVGTGELALTRFFENNGITRDSYKPLDTNAYQEGVNSARVVETANDMYNKSLPFIHDSKSYLSFMKGFSSVKNFSTSEIKDELLQNYIVQYSNTFDAETRKLIVDISNL